jgi:hypothetical protein
VKNFNVATDSLFFVAEGDQEKLVSALDIEKNGKKYSQFLGSPMQQATYMNAIVAILSDLKANGNTSQYDMSTFMQQPDLSTKYNIYFPWKTLAKNDVHREIGYCSSRIPVGQNEAYRFNPHPQAFEYELCQRCCAYGFLENILFARSGGQGWSPALAGENPLYVWKTGENLADFIQLNSGQPEKAGWDVLKTLGTPESPNLLTRNQTYTYNPRLMECVWKAPLQPCFLCGDCEMPHGSEMYSRGINTKFTKESLLKGFQKKWHGFKPTEKEHFLIVPCEDDRKLVRKDGKRMIATADNKTIAEAAYAQFGDKWIAIGMMVESVKKSSIFEQYLVTPDTCPQRRKQPPHKNFKKRLDGSRPKVVVPKPIISTAEVSREMIAKAVACLSEIPQEKLAMLRNACYGARHESDAEVLDFLDGLWRKVYQKTRLTFKRVFFQLVLAYACNPRSRKSGYLAKHLARNVQLLAQSPCSAVVFGEVDWYCVFSTMCGVK